jgi:formylglycine-generating enzyme required for sulfatase activity
MEDSKIKTDIFNISLILNKTQASKLIDKSTGNLESNIDKAILGKTIFEIDFFEIDFVNKNSEIVLNNNPYIAPKIPSPIISTETMLEILKPKTVRIPAGTFTMGSPKSEFDRADDETRHNVAISKDFLLCINPVTQELWRSVMSYDSNKIEKENLPITNISWNDVQDFIEKFNILTGEIYRLPTEAEWEYACRAGTDTAYSFGASINEDNANYKNKTFPMLKPVCNCLPNTFGLYDMHGNVWEWCEDWYGIYISTFQWLTNFSRTPLKDPYGPIKGEKRVIRGGSFNSLPKDLRSSCRSKLIPINNYNSVGFRLVKEI